MNAHTYGKHPTTVKKEEINKNKRTKMTAQIDSTHSAREFLKHPLVNTIVAALVGILCVYFGNKLTKSDDESRTIIETKVKLESLDNNVGDIKNELSEIKKAQTEILLRLPQK